jgi:uncharacterized lipoprotein YbaY
MIATIGTAAAGALVIGAIEFPEPVGLPPEAMVYVRLLDTSTADAPAVLVAEQVLRGATVTRDQSGRIPFELRAGPISNNKQYTVSVLVDVDASGHVTSGDYVSVQSYPVLIRGRADNVLIKVHRVR